MKRIFPLLAIVSLILLAGCASQIELPAGSGVEVTYFSAPSQIDSSDTFTVDLKVQNIGDNIAKTVKAELVQKSNFEIKSSAVKEADSLLPPVLESNVPGEEFTAGWVLKAPVVPEEQIKSIVARVTYEYSSNATSNIYVVPKEQYEEMGAESFQTYSTSTEGPVLIDIQPLPAFKIRSGQNSVNALVVLEIADVGGGYADKLKNFRLTLASGNKVEDKTSSCKDVPANREIMFLGRDRAVTLKCEFQLPASISAVSYIVSASADYTYYIDTEPVSIVVKP